MYCLGFVSTFRQQRRCCSKGFAHDRACRARSHYTRPISLYDNMIWHNIENESQHHSGEYEGMQGRFTMLKLTIKREAMASRYSRSLPRQDITKVINISSSCATEDHITNHGLRKHFHSQRFLSTTSSLPTLTTSDSLLGNSRPRSLERRLSTNRPRHPYNHLPLWRFR